jgi:hypothetical protein
MARFSIVPESVKMEKRIKTAGTQILFMNSLGVMVQIKKHLRPKNGSLGWRRKRVWGRNNSEQLECQSGKSNPFQGRITPILTAFGQKAIVIPDKTLSKTDISLTIIGCLLT